MPAETPLRTAIRSVAESPDPDLATLVMADHLAESPVAAVPLIPKFVPSWLGDLSAEILGSRSRGNLAKFIDGTTRPKTFAAGGWKRSAVGSVVVSDVQACAVEVIAKKKSQLLDPLPWLRHLVASLYDAAGHVTGLFHTVDRGADERGYRFLIAPRTPVPLAATAPPPHPADITRAGCPGCGASASRYFAFPWSRNDAGRTAELIAMTDPYLSRCCAHPIRVVKFPRGKRADALIARQ